MFSDKKYPIASGVLPGNAARAAFCGKLNTHEFASADVNEDATAPVNEPFKAGWRPESLRVAIDRCSGQVLELAFADYRRRRGLPPATADEITTVRNRLAKSDDKLVVVIRSTCECTVHEIARRHDKRSVGIQSLVKTRGRVVQVVNCAHDVFTLGILAIEGAAQIANFGDQLAPNDIFRFIEFAVPLTLQAFNLPFLSFSSVSPAPATKQSLRLNCSGRSSSFAAGIFEV